MPSVRGRQRLRVAAALLVSAVASGAAVGAATGVALVPVADALESTLFAGGESRPAVLVVGLVAGGVLLDLVALVSGRFTPPALGRQVPREWIDYFPPVTVAVLFGARLGVGPATILSTWAWWSVTVAAGLLGLGPAVAVGATFAAVRAVLTIAGSFLIEAADARVVMPRLRAGRRPGWAALNLAGLVGALALLAAGCGTPPDSGAPGQASSAALGDGAARSAVPDHESSVTTPARLEDVVRQRTLEPTDAHSDPSGGEERAASPLGGGSDASADTERLDVPADAVDVTESGTAAEVVSSTDTSTVGTAGEVVSLSDDLPVAIAGFERLEVPGTDRFLTLVDAAELQPDPSEEVALLETRGFLGGWTRAFRSDGNDVAVASVYEFADPTQAEFYLEDGLITIGGYGGTFFDIEGLPGVRGFAQSFDDGDEELLSLGAAYQSGSRWYLVYMVGSPNSVTPEVLVPAVAERWPGRAS